MEDDIPKRNAWTAGWRPGIGYVCLASFAYHFIIRDIGLLLVGVFGDGQIPDVPAFDTGPLLTLTFSLLGLGGLRTIEKFGNKTR